MGKNVFTFAFSCDRWRRGLSVLLSAAAIALFLSTTANTFAQQPPTARPQSQGETHNDRLKRALQELDPAMFNNLIGAEIDIEVIGDQMIIQGPQEAVQSLELLIRMIDESKDQKVLEIVRVDKRDANEIASTLEPSLREILRQPNQDPADELTITALSPSVLLVSALPKDIDFIIGVIMEVDEEEILPEFEQLVFPIKHRKATDVATQLNDIIQKINAKQGRSGAKAEIQVIPNNANNTVLVIAPIEMRERIQQLINEIDVEPVAGWGDVKLTIYPLLHSKARELADTITELLASQEQREAAEEFIYRLSITKALPGGGVVELDPIDLQKPTRIIPDEGTNSLIVATVEENIKPLGELIRLLDGVPTSEEIGIMIRPLRFADADSVADAINATFDQAKNLPEDPDGSGAGAVPDGLLGKIVYNISVVSDVRTNTIIVTGLQEQLSIAEMIVAELDQPANALKFPLRFIELEYTDATRLGQLITELFDQRFEAAQATGAGAAALERERIFLSVDIRSNSLIISASEENFVEITTIVRQLDTKPARLFDQIHLVQCGRLSAAGLKTKIEDLWQRKADLRREDDMLEDLPIIVVDERSNSMIIASNMEDFDEIKRLVATLESQPRIENIELFKLNFADSVVIADILDELFEGMASQSESFQAPTILPDPRSNALVAAGSRDAMERVAEMLKRLDVEAGPLTAIFKVYALQHASAIKMAERMQELFDSRNEGQDVTHTPIVILSEETSNSLVCSASRDDHVMIQGLLDLLDKPSNIARHFEIFPLKMAKANNISEKLDNLFQSQGTGTSGRADAIAVVADERTNSIIVWASPSEMVNIGNIIYKLDTSTPAVEMMIKVIQLKQALAEDFAELLDEVIAGEGAGGDDERAVIVSFLQKDENGHETVRKLLRQDIRIQADPRTNSLMVMAPVNSMNMLEAMILDFDKIRPITSEIRLFPLINSDADTMADQLTDLFEADGGGDGNAQNKLIFGGEFDQEELASVGQELRFSSDPRTNTLIVAGSEVYLNMVEDLVRYLDSQEAEDRVVEVYHARYRDGNDLANAVQGFIEQEINILGEGDDEESRMRRMERQISVEAIGDPEEGSSSLIIGTSRRSYQRTMDLIQSLDRPEPQVMISVLIAEVTLSDTAALGVEIAGQDLHFSEEAILGPNGIIQGSDFDYVLGSALGVPFSTLGVSFSVTGEDFGFLLHALQQNSMLEILSRPILTVRNGEEGTMTIADQIPIITSSTISDSGATNTATGREDVGIVLSATPHISPDGYVTIELSQEISNISGENIQLSEGITQPVFSTREVSTNVTVRDGETVIIGGLIQTRLSKGQNKIPLLGDLPYIGWLFRSENVTKSKTEMLIVLTVDIIRTDEDMRRITEEQFKRYELPESVLNSPLMEGIRITPKQNGLGPVTPQRNKNELIHVEPQQQEPRKKYGPRTKTYGPLISAPVSDKTSKVASASFGPKINNN